MDAETNLKHSGRKQRSALFCLGRELSTLLCILQLPVICKRTRLYGRTSTLPHLRLQGVVDDDLKSLAYSFVGLAMHILYCLRENVESLESSRRRIPGGQYFAGAFIY